MHFNSDAIIRRLDVENTAHKIGISRVQNTVTAVIGGNRLPNNTRP